MAGKVLEKAKNAVWGTAKFGALCGIGVVGTGVGTGVSMYKGMEKQLNSFACGLSLALINNMSMSTFEETINKHMWQEEQHPDRHGFDWAMASTFRDDGYQFGG